MRALRVVGLTEDGEVVLEDPVRLERFRVPADERLRAAARGDLSRLGQIAIELESQLRPREIQARIRAGASVEKVAEAAGVPEQKIERFAYPVLLERFRTAENAQRAHPVRADGPDNRTLGDVVAHTFGLRGQAYEGVRWDSWKGEDGRWVVALSWRAGRSENRAHWTFQPGAHGGTVTALDEHASDLVEGLPARPLRTVGAVVDINRPEEEPAPAPSPVEQWRAAASDSYRERAPYAPEQARQPADRGTTRTAEPWRPAPPAQRQPEPQESRPVEARLVEQRTGSHRDAEARPERENGHRPAAEWAPERGGSDRREPVVPEQAHAEQAPPEPARPEPAPPEPAPWDRGHLTEDTRPRTPADVPSAPLPIMPEPDAVEPAVAEPAVPAPPIPTPPVPEVVTQRPAPEVAPERVTVPPAEAVPSAEATAAPEPTPQAPAPQEPAPQEPTAEAPAPEAAPAAPPAEDAPAADAPAANRRTRKGKPVMPSWDEVLLGVRGPR